MCFLLVSLVLVFSSKFLAGCELLVPRGVLHDVSAEGVF